MATTDELKPYELLIRFDPVTGLLAGSHYVRSRVVTLDGQVILNQATDPEPVAAADLDDLSGLMSEMQQTALATVEANKAEIARLTAALDAANTALTNVTAERDAALAAA